MSLYSATQHLAVVLRQSGYRVEDHVPEQVEPPCLVIEPAEDCIAEGDTFDADQVTVRLDVWLFVELRAGNNAHSVQQLSTLMAQVWPLIYGSDWTVTRTTKPGPQTNGDWLHYGVCLTAETITSN